MIYIDPPYNTGKEFTYNDTFEFDDEKLKNILGYDDKDIARLKSLQGKSSHSAWLTFMYPRLRLAQKLLTDDGVIFVSIDDNEQANLKLLLDDVFGEGNFVSKFIWEKSQHFGRQKLNYYSNADYILCYAKQLSENGSLKELLIERILDEFDDAPLQNASNNVKDLTFPAGTVKFNIKDGTYNKTTSTDYILIKSVVVENGCNKNDLIFRFKSRWANNTVQHEITKGTTFWVKTENFAIRTLYGPDKRGTAAPKQIIFTNSKNEFCAKNKFGMKVDTSEIATEIVNNLLQCEAFSYPKPNSLIAYFISLCANDPNDIILDFFAGSGTTAHAVMQLNAEDGGNRKFILVQIDEKTKTDSEAFKAGYQTIDEIARERIKRAAKKIKTEKGLALPENFDGGFKHFRLVAPDVKTLDKIETFDPDKPLQKDIFENMVTKFDAKQEDGGAKGDEAILQTWFIDDGYTFDQTPQVIDFDGYKACYIDNSVLYIINPGWGAEQTKMLLNQIGTHQLNVNTIIVYGYSFTMESLRELEMNVKNILNRQVSIAIRY
jgi:adenine-specific DNA-methyltransferase